MTTRLTRSQDDRILGGVCGGLGRYLNVDPVLVRLAFVLFTLAGGAGALAYLILLIVMPLDTDSSSQVNYDDIEMVERKRRTNILVGAGMVLFGIWFLLGKIPALAWLSAGNLWPLLLVIIGAVMIFRYIQQKDA